LVIFFIKVNWNAVQYLKETIWLLIKKQFPDAIINVYCAYPSQKVLELNNIKDSFLIRGRADNTSGN
jgi:hypothetical protein